MLWHPKAITHTNHPTEHNITNISKYDWFPTAFKSTAPSTFKGKCSVFVIITPLSCFLTQDMASVTVASASAIQTGKEKTVTAPGGLIPACLTWVCCAVAEASVCVGPVSAPSQALMGPRVTSVPPAPMPALWRSESSYTFEHWESGWIYCMLVSL